MKTCKKEHKEIQFSSSNCPCCEMIEYNKELKKALDIAYCDYIVLKNRVRKALGDE